jgi:hypothetical protein
MEPITLRSRPLDELVLTVVVDNETDTLSSVGADIPQHTEMIGHLGRSTPTTASSGHACFEVFDHLCVACHGFSVLLQGRVGSEVRTALFDAGPYGDVWLDNASRLDIDLAAIEVVFLSHWHWDHSGALPTRGPPPGTPNPSSSTCTPIDPTSGAWRRFRARSCSYRPNPASPTSPTPAPRSSPVVTPTFSVTASSSEVGRSSG